MPLSRYPKQLFQEEWNMKPCRGRQRKVWKRIVYDIFESLELDKGEWVESISKDETSINEFLALVDGCSILDLSGVRSLWIHSDQ